MKHYETKRNIATVAIVALGKRNAVQIHVTFKKYPASGKFIRVSNSKKKYYVVYEGKNRRLPKWIWDKL